jgi:hypothetical protein
MEGLDVAVIGACLEGLEVYLVRAGRTEGVISWQSRRERGT